MSTVALTIGGRMYSVACRDGGEDHLLALGARVDAKVGEARAAVGTASEVRQLLFAALLLADEAVSPTASDEALAASLTVLADRVEGIADALESATGPA